MSSNREKRYDKEYLHLFLGLKRIGTNTDHECLRTVIYDENRDLKMFEARLLCLGGEWRIHRTVNARCPQKAMKHLIKKLIDHPEKAPNIATEWRTSLLQPENIYGNKKFLLDIDTNKEHELLRIKEIALACNADITLRIKSPKGEHWICKPFDTREICKEENVSLIRDGYYYVKTVRREEKKL